MKTEHQLEHATARNITEGWRRFAPDSLPDEGEHVLVLVDKTSSPKTADRIAFVGYVIVDRDAFDRPTVRGFVSTTDGPPGLYTHDRVLAWMRLPSTQAKPGFNKVGVYLGPPSWQV
jgi:hypothetical protein